MVDVDGLGWEVRVDGGTAVVELPRRLVLDERSGARLSEAVSSAVSEPGVDRVVLSIAIEHPLGTPLHEAVVRAARTAAANGVTDWRVVAEHEPKATAVARALPDVEATVVDDKRSAQRA